MWVAGCKARGCPYVRPVSYTVFARKYRPKTFDDVLGQDHVVRTLRNAITQDRLAQAYLFVGPRGTGKTSTARIFAKALNCTGGPRIDFDPDEDACVEIAEGRSLDVLEIDGASNNGVDQVRDLRDSVSFAPARGKFRIFYIDEVHMLTAAAFNALLKTLEEPPPHVKFIFATTEAHKILPTIISRCQRFDLRRIPTNVIADHLLEIAKKESIKLDRLAAHAIARGADGGMRDAQSMLDQLVAFCGQEVQETDVLHIFGFTSYETVANLSDKILRGLTAAALTELHAQAEAGKDLGKLLADLIFHFRNLLVFQVDAAVAMTDLPPEMEGLMQEQSRLRNSERLMHLLDQFAETDANMRWAPNKRLCFEIGIIKATQSLGEAAISDVIAALGGALGNVPAVVELTPPPPQPATLAPRQTAPAINASISPAPAAKATEEVPAPVPTASTPLTDGQEIWAATLRQIDSKMPLTASWAHQGVFCEVKKGRLVIGFPPDEEIACESLQRPSTRSEIDRILLEVSGQALVFSPEIREGLVAPVVQEAPDELLAEADPSEFLPSSLAEDPPAPPVPPTAAESTLPPPEAADDDADDELIREALDIFDAKIATKKSP